MASIRLVSTLFDNEPHLGADDHWIRGSARVNGPNQTVLQKHTTITPHMIVLIQYRETRRKLNFTNVEKKNSKSFRLEVVLISTKRPPKTIVTLLAKQNYRETTN
ncbi:hypothetical protein CEXT_757601 [Caerostris extrusa]|uniref:Uncharacterized protein n=1 Tax=Caerostris extrusa TaxID=172846 RepID=A0AAV4YBN6_CAEEX|nr:hypothetical protein CEXT_757601 [Caerostris extrusa]